ncbi:chalcone isomerase family protein [Alphaproteobacteria bacterium]|nr:chalcone isomerase family protein [Alphaproteobacteria bacterium]
MIFRNGRNNPIKMIGPMISFVVASICRMMRLGMFMIAMLLGSMTITLAEPWTGLVPDAEIVGKARFKVFLFKIYDATLFAPNGQFDPDGVYALRLSYLVDASKAQIVKRSLVEMDRQTKAGEEQLKIWKVFLDASFRDLKDGESATAIHNRDGSITFYLNDVEGETINDADFADAFMNIWLSDKAKDLDFSRALRGLDDQS